MEYYFIDRYFESHIRDVINNLFIKLNSYDKDILIKYVLGLIDLIAYQFNFNMEKKELYYSQFKQNNNRDIIGVINLILPFIDDSDGYALQKELESFNDLYIAKKQNNADPSINNYKYTNIQYGRAKRTKIDKIKDIKERYESTQNDIMSNGNLIFNEEEIKFDEHYLIQNVDLLSRTILDVSNKLYVNWINIRPLINIKDSILYKRSQRILERSAYNYEFDKKIDGLFIGDIYNTIVGELYNKIKKIRWVIFEKFINKKFYNHLYILSNFIDFEKIIQNIDWDELDEQYKIKFKYQWEQLFQIISSKSKYEIFENEVLLNVIQSVGQFMSKNYTEQNEISNIVDDINFITKVDISHLYTYLQETISQLLITWYGNKLIDIDNNTIYSPDNIPDKYKLPTVTLVLNEKIQTNITFKNIYNYAKGLQYKIITPQEKNDIPDDIDETLLTNITKFPSFYKSLNELQRFIITHRLNHTGDPQVPDWFNIMKILKTNLNYSNTQNLTVTNFNIYQKIRSNIIDIVMNSLSEKGLLIEFIPTPELTDNKLLPTDYKSKQQEFKKRLKNIVFDNKKYEESTYFLTEKPYNKLDKIRTSVNGIYKDLSYFDYLIEEGTFLSFYALDWLSQINFFHHFINNQIIYVTGSTGQGKSTQIPKLLLYAMKMIYYKNDGKIICTEPRRNPTVNNAERISMEMGVPIYQYSNTQHELMDTTNGFIQYKHQQKQHIVRNVNTFLRIVTDGTLKEELQQNIILKRKQKNKINYTDKNIYDIVIIDEAHEHNANMDLILTMMRNTTYINNSVKLIIISATMDIDEPIYRRYYRDINDNMMYPNNKDLEIYNLDRINVDRRFHISPPGETTLHKITDIYMNKSKELDTFENNEIDAINTVQKISKETNGGHILLFTVGRQQITNECQQLNNLLPTNFICVPFYGDMSIEWRSKIGEIEKTISGITVDRRNIVDVIAGTMKEENAIKVSPNTYNRAVIVATNVAEASITIADLRYVVDIGFINVVRFDYKTKLSIAEIDKITETSRIQRRGRVGRIADGSVYYMYAEGSRQEIMPEYAICINDIHRSLYDMLQKNDPSKPEMLLLEPKYDPHLKDVTHEQIPTNHPLYSLITSQYPLNFDDTFFGYEDQYDYHNLISLNYYMETGFKYETLFDEYGRFYLIHPDETMVKRKLLTGEIIARRESIDSKYENVTITSLLKIFSFMKILKDMLLIVDLNIYFTFANLSDSGVLTNDMIRGEFISKTNRGVQLYNFLRDKENDIPKFITTTDQDEYIPLLYSNIFGCYPEMCTLLLMLFAKYDTENKFSIASWYRLIPNEKGKTYPDKEHFDNTFRDSTSDFITLLNVYNRFNSIFSNLLIFTNTQKILNTPQYFETSNNDQFSKDLEIYKDIKSQIKRGQLNKYDIPLNINLGTYLQFQKYDENNLLDNKQRLLKDYNMINETTNKNQMINITENREKISDWCEKNYVNFDAMYGFLINYSKYFSQLMNLQNKINILNSYFPIYQTENTKNNNLIKCFYCAHRKNITYWKDTYFHNIGMNYQNDKKLRELYPVSSLNQYSQWMSYYAKSYNKNKDIQEIQFLSKIPLNWISAICPDIFNPLMFSIQNDSESDKIKQSDLLNSFDINSFNSIFSVDDKILQTYYTKLITKIQEYINNHYRQIGGNLKNGRLYKIKFSQLLTKTKLSKHIHQDISKFKNDPIYVHAINKQIVGIYSIKNNDNIIINKIYSKNDDEFQKLLNGLSKKYINKKLKF